MHFEMRFSDKYAIESKAYSCLDCWDDDGYHPERSWIPHEAQIVCTTEYAHSTIVCDGFEVFFAIPVGNAAPEILEFLMKYGFNDGANALREAMEVLCGLNYCRSLEKRESLLQQLDEEAYRRWNKLLGEYDTGIDNHQPSLADTADEILMRINSQSDGITQFRM